MSTLTAVLLTIHLCGFVIAFVIGLIGAGLGLSKSSRPKIFLMAMGWEILLGGSILASLWRKFDKATNL